MLSSGFLERKSAEKVTEVIVDSLRALAAPVHTLTFDNGTEFCGHQAIARALKARCFFADPRAPWQRGLNENHNGLVRQYIPKKRSPARGYPGRNRTDRSSTQPSPMQIVGLPNTS